MRERDGDRERPYQHKALKYPALRMRRLGMCQYTLLKS